jgi:signal transduction histidine kinase
MYRGDRSRSQRGLGLGLSLVKAIVEAHHGEVSVESEPGRGAVFRVMLPSA